MSMNGTKVVTELGTSGSETAIVGEVTNSQDFAFDMIETTTKSSSAGAKTYETGEYGGTLAVEAKVKLSDGATIKALFDAAKAGTAQSSIVSSSIVGDIQIAGNALISGISLGNPQNDVRTVSYNLQYTGVITATVIAS
jgi:hypothetical protein